MVGHASDGLAALRYACCPVQVQHLRLLRHPAASQLTAPPRKALLCAAPQCAPQNYVLTASRHSRYYFCNQRLPHIRLLEIPIMISLHVCVAVARLVRVRLTKPVAERLTAGSSGALSSAA
jgi:hypothetical protein